LFIQVEDFINSSSTTPLSSTPVQFIVKVIDPPSCTTLPEVLLIGQSCTTVEVNETFSSQLLAINYCGTNVSIVDIATLSFSGMLQSSVIKLSSLIYYKTLTWTPTINQLGYQVMCAMALDRLLLHTIQYLQIKTFFFLCIANIHNHHNIVSPSMLQKMVRVHALELQTAA